MPYIRLLTVLTTLLSLPLSASDRLFLFDAGSTAATVLDGRLQRVGRATVSEGAFAAFRAKGRFFVVARDRVNVLDESLNGVGEIPLEGGAATAAALDPRTADLLVSAGGTLYRIDTDRGRIAAAVESGVQADHIHVAAGAGVAHLFQLGSRQVRSFNLETNQMLPGASDLAAVPAVFAGGLIGAGNEVFRANPLSSGIAGRLVRSSVAPALLAASPSGATLMRSEGGLLHVAADGVTVTRLADPATGLAPAEVLRAALSPDGAVAYAALADGRLLALDTKGEAPPAEVWLASAPSALALTSAPSQVQSIFLVKDAGDQQAVTEGSDFEIQVSARFADNTPIFGGASMTIEPDPDIIECQDPLPPLSGVTTVTCSAGAVSSITQASLVVSVPALGISTTYTIFVVPANLPDGLFKVAGDNQTVRASDQFSLTVEARLGGVPRVSAQLTVTDNSNFLQCTSGLLTNSSGRATINCQVFGTVSSSETATITVSDSLANSVNFTINVIGQPGSNNALVKITPDPVTVFEGLNLTLTVEARFNSSPQDDVTLSIFGGSGNLSCPATVVTDDDGRATIVCQAGSVNRDVLVSLAITDGTNTIGYDVVVRNFTLSNGLQKMSGDNQIVETNTPFLAPLVVRAVSEGQPQLGLSLSVSVSGGGAACGLTALTDSNGLASITCVARPVIGINNVQIQVTDGAGRNLAEPFRATVVESLTGGVADDVDVISEPVLTGGVGQTLFSALQVRTVTDSGAAVPNTPVFLRAPQGISVDPAVAVTNQNGIAAFNVYLGCGPTTGRIHVGLTPTSSEKTVDFSLTTGAVTQLINIQGDGQTGVPGQRLPTALVVQSSDVCGGAVSSVGVSWAVVPPDAATLENIGASTNSQGRASVLVRPSTRGGPFQVVATATQNGDVQPAVFSLTTQNTASGLRILSGNQQTVPAGAAAATPLVVEVFSSANQPVQGVTVTFQVVSGSATLGTASGVTNAQGQAFTSLTAGSVRGPVLVRAQAAGQLVEFNLTVGGGAPQLQLPGFTNGASFVSGFVPGATGSIFGVNITGDLNGVALAPYDPVTGFPTLFLGVRVIVGGVAVPILGMKNVDGQEQVNIQVPFTLAQGTVTVVIENNGTSATINGVPVFSAQPGVFEYPLNGQLYAAAQHANFDLVTPDNPARPGELIIVYVTALGALNPPVLTNQAGPASPLSSPILQPTVILGGVPQQFDGAYYSPGLVTVYQIHFRVSAGTQRGNIGLTVTSSSSPSKQVALPVGAPL